MKSIGMFFGAVGLIGSSLIGAGILAFPVTLGLAGLPPALLAMVVYGALMLFSGEVLIRETAARRDPAFNLPDVFQEYLGVTGKWIAVAANLLVLYGLLIAYITSGAKILESLFGMQEMSGLITPVLGLFLIGLASGRLTLLQKYNMALIGILTAVFLMLVILGEPHTELARLGRCNWEFLPSAVPLVLTAFYFHNIIPVVGADLQWNGKRMRLAAFCGFGLAFLMGVLWLQTGIGALPMHGENGIMNAYRLGVPATIPMSAIMGSKLFVVCAIAFAMITVSTAFIGNGVALQSFMRGLVRREATVKFLAFAPPLLIAWLWPGIFLKAVDVVGGIGVVTLFGILPCLIAIRSRGSSRGMKIAGTVFLILSLGALGMEALQEFGITHFTPDAEVEYWKDNSVELINHQGE